MWLRPILVTEVSEAPGKNNVNTEPVQIPHQDDFYTGKRALRTFWTIPTIQYNLIRGIEGKKQTKTKKHCLGD